MMKTFWIGGGASSFNALDHRLQIVDRQNDLRQIELLAPPSGSHGAFNLVAFQHVSGHFLGDPTPCGEAFDTAL